jgi:hypothetical protein
LAAVKAWSVGSLGIFVVGDNGGQARAVAEAIVRDAFHNVSFFDGAVSDVPELVQKPGP